MQYAFGGKRLKKPSNKNIIFSAAKSPNKPGFKCYKIFSSKFLEKFYRFAKIYHNKINFQLGDFLRSLHFLPQFFVAQSFIFRHFQSYHKSQISESLSFKEA